MLKTITGIFVIHKNKSPLSLVFVSLMVVCILSLHNNQLMASSPVGHYGQAIYLLSIEMPAKAKVYEKILGTELFASLTGRKQDGTYEFDIDHLTPEQAAFENGALGPDRLDISVPGWPVHNESPQQMLDFINYLTAHQVKIDGVKARAYFFGWAFHYITDLVVHPGMNEETELRKSREYSKRPGPHLVYEGITDKIAIYYKFLLNPEAKVSPSKVFSNGYSRTQKLVAHSEPRSREEKKAFLKDPELANTLYDRDLKEFDEIKIPEGDILAGKTIVKEFFDSPSPYVKGAISDAVNWFQIVMNKTPKGFENAISRKGFNRDLDTGKTLSPEVFLSIWTKKSAMDLYNEEMGRMKFPDEHDPFFREEDLDFSSPDPFGGLELIER